MSAEIVKLDVLDLRDGARLLHSVADRIEAGEFGDVQTVAVVLLGDTMEVFSAGDESRGSDAAVLMQAGALRIIKAIEAAGK